MSDSLPRGRSAPLDTSAPVRGGAGTGLSLPMLQIVLENTGDLIYVMDPEGRLRYVSPSVERILGFTPEEVIGRSADDFTHPDDRARVAADFAHSIQHPDTTRRFEVRTLRKDGSYGVFEVYGRIVEDEQGIPVAVVTSHEITERKRLEEHRAQVLQFVGHDLCTPLTNILLHADLLRVSLGERVREGPDRESLQTIIQSTEQMEILIRDILDTERADAGGLWLMQEPLSSASLLRDAVATLQPLARERSIRLELGPAPAVLIHADRERLLQVLSNLVSNALRFTPEGGRVTLGADTRAYEVCFWVADTGCGIEEEHLCLIFERYWQAQPRRSGTTGLGLAIAKGLVEAHGGRIWAESTPGEGSTFFFTVPRHAEA